MNYLKHLQDDLKIVSPLTAIRGFMWFEFCGCVGEVDCCGGDV